MESHGIRIVPQRRGSMRVALQQGIVSLPDLLLLVVSFEGPIYVRAREFMIVLYDDFDVCICVYTNLWKTLEMFK